MKPAVINAFTKVYYDVLKQEIINNGMFDTDVYHDTYVALYSAPDMPLTPKMFKSVYRHLLRRELSRTYTTVSPSETFFQLLANPAEDNSTASEEVKDRVTATEVKGYARIALSPSDYKLFFLRFIKELTLKQTGEYIGRSQSYVLRHTEDIKSTISNHFNQLAI